MEFDVPDRPRVLRRRGGVETAVNPGREHYREILIELKDELHRLHARPQERACAIALLARPEDRRDELGDAGVGEPRRAPSRPSASSPTIATSAGLSAPSRSSMARYDGRKPYTWNSFAARSRARVGVVGHADRQRRDDLRRRPARALGGRGDRRHGVRRERRRTGHPRDGAVGHACRRARASADRARRSSTGGGATSVDAELDACVEIVSPVNAHLPSCSSGISTDEVLAHVPHRLLERQAEHALDHDLVREPDAEREPPAARGLHRAAPAAPSSSGGAGRSARRRSPSSMRGHLAADDREHAHRVEPEDLGERVAREPVRFGRPSRRPTTSSMVRPAVSPPKIPMRMLPPPCRSAARLPGPIARSGPGWYTSRLTRTWLSW